MLPLLLLAACAHVGPRLDPDALPVLPSPRATLYARAPGAPPDPLVASVAGGLPWDEALSGVAAATALAEVGGEKVDLCRLRWMAMLAGYPYPLIARASAAVARNAVPDALIASAREQAHGQVDIGLVRARGNTEDRWVLLVGQHLGDVPPIPREVAVGEAVTLGTGTWVVSDPYGIVRDVKDGVLHPDTAGEWMLSARDRGTVIATVPLYVGEPSPEAPPLKCVARAGGPADQAGAMLADIRTNYGYTALEHDDALDSVARARLRTFASGAPLPDVGTQLRSAGYVGVPVAGAECRAESVASCLEKIWWAPEQRGALVGDLTAYGVATQQAGDQVLLVLVGAG